MRARTPKSAKRLGNAGPEPTAKPRDSDKQVRTILRHAARTQTLESLRISRGKLRRSPFVLVRRSFVVRRSSFVVRRSSFVRSFVRSSLLNKSCK